MNLFTTYTQEEINFLLSLKEKRVEEFDDLHRIKLFNEVDKKEFEYIYLKRLFSKEVIRDYDFLIVLKGELAVIENKRVVKKIKENDIYGYFSLIGKNRAILLSLTNSEVLFFKLKNKNSAFFYNLIVFECLKNCK